MFQWSVQPEFASGGIDPFALWKHLRPGAGGRRRFLVCVPPDANEAKGLLADMQLVPTPHYLQQGAAGRCFWTARNAEPGELAPRPRADSSQPARYMPGDIALVPGDMDVSAIWWKLNLDRLGAAFMRVPRPGTFGRDHPHNASFLAALNHLTPLLEAQRLRLASPQMMALRAAAGPAPTPTQAAAPVKKPVLAVIDDTCAFLHAALRKRAAAGAAPSTRLISLWDQTETATAAAPWLEVPEFGYGRELTRQAIDAELTTLHSAGGHERDAYRRLQQDVPQGEAPWSHGTHVLAIAGGQRDPFAASAAANTDAAGDLDLIAVQVPKGAIAATHGLWLNGYILDALHYILLRADGAPVIVNISMGGNIGPHNGTSLLERAIDDLIEAHDGRLTVVLAAGNNRLQHMHSSATLAQGQAADFAADIQADDRTPNFIDIWADAASDALSMKVGFSVAGGPQSNPVDLAPGQAFALKTTDATPRTVALASLSHAGKAVNGAGMQGFLGVAATWEGGVPYGRWTMNIKNDGPSPVTVNAWIARDDVPAGYGAGLQQEQLQFSAVTAADMRASMSSLAGGAHPVVVGGYVTVGGGAPVMYEPSGAGAMPGFRPPDTCGPASVQGEGVPDVWFLSDEPVVAGGWLRRKTGTSMASPFVARRLANTMAKDAAACTGRAALLSAFKSAYPSINPIEPMGQPDWTASHWTPFA
ncbi:MAG TPA: S8 family serine peptidase [Burkholderiaceae bacterium]|nr:S8 family serine peptidase [Burkholderiaceae bacterium]